MIDRSNAFIIKAFFEHFLLYGCLRAAVRHTADKYDKLISPSTGKNWLTNAVYRGDLAYHTKNNRHEPPQVVRDTHPAITSRDEVAQVDRLRRRNKALPTRSASAA